MTRIAILVILAGCSSPSNAPGDGSPGGDAPTFPGTEGTVPSNASVRSAKRGVAAGGNDYPAGLVLAQSDLDALAPGLSWFYNWAASSDVLDAQQRIEFLPTAWGHDGDVAAVQAWLAAHPETTAVLAANEPNRSDQANLSPADCAAFIQATRAIAGSRPVIGPHLAAGDPTTVATYRNAVAAALGDMPATGIHIYDNTTAGYDYWEGTWPHQNWTGATDPGAVWIKELNLGDGTATEDAVIAHMIHAVDLMERDTRVVRYAWWKDRRKDDGTIAPGHFLLSATANGELTALGDLYVHMPVHSPMLWYAVPGRLEAERYVMISDAQVTLARTGDARASPSDVNGDGWLDATIPNGGWLDYNLDVADGSHTLSLRLDRTQASTVEVSVGGTVLGTITTTAGSGYATTDPIDIALASGRQTVRLKVTSGSARINWLSVE